MKTGIIIQARMGSTRLPGKVLMKLNEKTILEYVIERCRLINNIDKIVVAITDQLEDDIIANWCKENKIDFFRGSENNVLKRFIDCAEYYNFETIIRVTADCPFLDYEIANEVLSLATQNKEFDLWAIKENWTRGLAIEIVKLAALKKVLSLTNDNLYLEHVTLYIYKNTDKFIKKDFYVPVGRRFPQFRLTIDTEEDLKVGYLIAKHFESSDISCVKIFDFLKRNQNIALINQNIKQTILSGNE